jgi:CRISPR-associated protein Cas5h
MKVLAFDIWGEYAHYKKIYATTSAVSYCLPTKTALYGYVSAILGLEKENNQYLKFFQNKACLMGIQILNPIVMQRININLRATLGRMKSTDNRKPTTMEFVYQPKYRIFFFHKQTDIQEQLKERLSKKSALYTPTMGLAGLISNFDFISEFEASPWNPKAKSASIQTVIPKKHFESFDIEALKLKRTEIIEQSMYAIEMDVERNVTERDDILLERRAKSIDAFLNQYYQLSNGANISLF